MTFLRYLLGIVAVLLSCSLKGAPARSDAELSRLLAGEWIEVFDAKTSSTHHFGSDGRYWSVGNVSNATLPRVLIEGTWRIEKGHLRYTIAACSDAEIDPAQLSCNDEILELSDHRMRYRSSAVPGETAEMKRQTAVRSPSFVRGKIVGGWALTYERKDLLLSKEVLFHPSGIYTEKGSIRIPDGTSFSERKYELLGAWRFLNDILVIDIESSSAPSLYAAKAKFWAEVVALDNHSLVMHPSDSRTPVTARSMDIDLASPAARPASVSAPQTKGRLFGIPPAAPLSAEQAKIIHGRIIPEKVTAVAIGLARPDVFSAYPELDREGTPGFRGRDHGADLGEGFLFSQCMVTFHREKVVEIEFSGTGEGVVVSELVHSFDWLFKTLGDATQFFTNDLDEKQTGAELIGAAWATPQALIVLSFHVSSTDLYPKLGIYDPKHTLSDVRTMENIRYFADDHVSCRPLYQAWAREVAKLKD